MSSIDILKELREEQRDEACSNGKLIAEIISDGERWSNQYQIEKEQQDECLASCRALTEAIEALEKVVTIRNKLDSMPAIFDKRYGGMFVDRDYLKRFIDSLDKSDPTTKSVAGES